MEEQGEIREGIGEEIYGRFAVLNVDAQCKPAGAHKLFITINIL